MRFVCTLKSLDQCLGYDTTCSTEQVFEYLDIHVFNDSLSLFSKENVLNMRPICYYCWNILWLNYVFELPKNVILDLRGFIRDVLKDLKIY